MGKKKSNILFIVLVAALLLVTAFLLFPIPQKPRQSVSKSVSANSDEASELVNKHLYMTNQASEMAEKTVEVQNAYTNPKIGTSILPNSKSQAKKNEPPLGVDHSPDSNETTAFDDLNRYPKTLQAGNPNHIIQAQLQDAEKAQAYSEAYRAEYARQFIENARRNGYDVRLDNNLVVVYVKQIRNPSSDLRPQAK